MFSLVSGEELYSFVFTLITCWVLIIKILSVIICYPIFQMNLCQIIQTGPWWLEVTLTVSLGYDFPLMMWILLKPAIHHILIHIDVKFKKVFITIYLFKCFNLPSFIWMCIEVFYHLLYLCLCGYGVLNKACYNFFSNAYVTCGNKDLDALSFFFIICSKAESLLYVEYISLNKIWSPIIINDL